MRGNNPRTRQLPQFSHLFTGEIHTGLNDHRRLRFHKPGSRDTSGNRNCRVSNGAPAVGSIAQGGRRYLRLAGRVVSAAEVGNLHGGDGFRPVSTLGLVDAVKAARGWYSRPCSDSRFSFARTAST